jgi:hypothetical protein
MTRINVGVHPSELSTKHLIAEHREIKRIPNNVNFKNALYHYQASYQIKGDEVKVSRIFESNHKSSVSGPTFGESRNAVFKVLQRDLRSQIFYD